MKDMETKINTIYKHLNLLYQQNKNLELSSLDLIYIRKEILLTLREYLKTIVLLQKSYHLNFNSLKNTNCYFFALGLPIPSIFKNVYEKLLKMDFGFDIGEISGNGLSYNEPLTKENLINRIYDDLSYLNIKFYPIYFHTRCNHRGEKISIFISDQKNDYHLIRQLHNGLWYHKNGYNKGIECLGKINGLEDIGFIDDNNRIYEYFSSLEIVKPNIKR